MIVTDEKTQNQIIILVLGVIIGATGSLANSLILLNAFDDEKRKVISPRDFFLSSLETPARDRRPGIRGTRR
jgi:hypothetical protein